MKNFNLVSRQNGAALVIGLILLVVVTVLAVSGMSTATTELAMARNNQNYENAFQAAETGLERALSQGRFNTLNNVSLVDNITDNDSVTATVQFENSTLVPDRAFSLGSGSSISAYHFIATAVSESRREGTAGAATSRDASAVHTQAFYVVGPEAPTL
jgi:type IV pilus assembly protein PilX